MREVVSKKRLWLSASVLVCLSYSSHAAQNLSDVYRDAAQNDTELRSAETERQAARQRYKQSVAQLIFSADISGDVTSQTREIGNNSDDNTTKGYSLSLVQPVFRYDRWKQVAQTDALIGQAEANYKAVAQNLLVRTAERYFNVLAALDDLDLAGAEKDADARQLEQTKQRFEVGLIAITDVHESQAAFDNSVAREIASQNGVSNAREALRELTTQYYDDLKRLVEDIPLLFPDPQDVNSWVNTAVKENYNVVAAQASVDAARENIGVQKSGHLPYADLVGQHSYVDEAQFFGNESLTDSSIALQVTLPLFRGGGTVARVKEAEYNYSQVLENREQVTRAVYRQASQAYLTVISKVNEVKALAQSVVSSKSALEASEAGLEVGTRTTLDVLNTRRVLFRAKRDYLRSRYDYVLSTLILKEAAGTLSQDDFRKISEYLQ